MSQVPSYVSTSEHDPRQWSKWRRWMIALVIWNMIAPVDVTITFYSGVQQQIQECFQTTAFIATLGVGLFNSGSMFGPLIGGPLSELYGRRPIYIGASVGFVFFSILTALAPSMITLLVCRALAGLLGSAIFALYGGSLADMFDSNERGSLVALFTVVLQGAPTIGPVPSSLLGPLVHWRLLMGCIAAWAAIITAMVVYLPETEAKAIQRRISKARCLDFQDDRDKSQSLVLLLRKALLTPITMLRCEPIVTWTTLYHAFVYGLLFLLLEAYPHVYKSHYDMSRQQTGLVFIAPWVGNILGVLAYFCILKPTYDARQRAILAESAGKRDIPPEGRLPGITLASLCTPIGMLWFALSAHPDIHWLVPVLSGIPVGMGMTLMQLSLLSYYMDLYPTQSASVVAANCAARNAASTIFPSLGAPLYTYFGIRSASLLLACISCMGFPIALILILQGKKLRAASKWAKQDTVDAYDTEPYFDIVTPLKCQLSGQLAYGAADARN